MSVIAYSFIDKRASSLVNPFVYVYFFEFVSLVLLTFIVVKTKDSVIFRREFHKYYLSMLISAVLIVLSYAIVVYIMRTVSLSYIVSIREVGIVFGVLQGVILLKEPFVKKRIATSLIITLGIIIISVG